MFQLATYTSPLYEATKIVYSESITSTRLEKVFFEELFVGKTWEMKAIGSINK